MRNYCVYRYLCWNGSGSSGLARPTLSGRRPLVWPPATQGNGGAVWSPGTRTTSRSPAACIGSDSSTAGPSGTGSTRSDAAARKAGLPGPECASAVWRRAPFPGRARSTPFRMPASPPGSKQDPHEIAPHVRICAGWGRDDAVYFLAAPSAADGKVGRGCRYPTPAASLARDRQSPRTATQNEKVNSIGGRENPHPYRNPLPPRAQRSRPQAAKDKLED